jgi:hypothetical protein
MSCLFLAEKVVPPSTVGDTVSEKSAVSVVLSSADCSDAGPSHQSTEGYNHDNAGSNHYSHGPKGVSVESSHPGVADANTKTSEGSEQVSVVSVLDVLTVDCDTRFNSITILVM